MKTRYIGIVAVALAAGCGTMESIERIGQLPVKPQPLSAHPPSDRAPVTDTYHGTAVVDEYRWLENWDDPKVKAWSEAQNTHARSHLDAIKVASMVRERLTELETSSSVSYGSIHEAGGTIFAVKNQPPKQQPLIVAFKSLDTTASERVIVDPNELDKSGHTAFDWYVPSPDGKLVAVSLSEGGSESGNVHVYRTDTGEELKGDMIPGVNGGTAGGTLAWFKDSSGFFYSRYPRKGERAEADLAFYVQIYSHQLGTSEKSDKHETGKDYPKIAEIVAEVSPDGKWALTNVQNGDGGEFIQDLRSPDGTWTRLSKWDDRIVEAKFGHDGALYLVSRKNAPKGKVLRLALGAGTPTLSAAKEVVPERQDGSIETDFFGRNGLFVTKNRLYVLYQVGGPNELRVFDLAGKALATVPSLPVSTVEGIESIGSGDDIVFQNDSFVSPPAYYRYSAASNQASKTALFIPEPPRMPKLEVKRAFARSKDGTMVPIHIVTRAGYVPDGRTPTLVYGYGGYGVNETPSFSKRRLLWIEQGCVFVLANIRGGGEYGEEWHLNGNLTKKQNVFDDFHAACTHVIGAGYTNRDKLAIMGGSNGGLLMGAMFTQHPDLCKAVVSSVGIYDMLRVELSSNGEFNITEFGTVKNPDHFRALRAYSPYHNVRAGTKYPAILFLTGANDPRVDPMQSRKMTALLQSASPNTITLLRTSGNTGHGQGTPLGARIEQNVDVYGFLFEQLGVEYKPVK